MHSTQMSVQVKWVIWLMKKWSCILIRNDKNTFIYLFIYLFMFINTYYQTNIFSNIINKHKNRAKAMSKTHKFTQYIYKIQNNW